MKNVIKCLGLVLLAGCGDAGNMQPADELDHMEQNYTIRRTGLGLTFGARNDLQNTSCDTSSTTQVCQWVKSAPADSTTYRINVGVDTAGGGFAAPDRSSILAQLTPLVSELNSLLGAPTSPSGARYVFSSTAPNQDGSVRIFSLAIPGPATSENLKDYVTVQCGSSNGNLTESLNGSYRLCNQMAVYLDLQKLRTHSGSSSTVRNRELKMVVTHAVIAAIGLGMHATGPLAYSWPTFLNPLPAAALSPGEVCRARFFVGSMANSTNVILNTTGTCAN